MRRRKHRSWPSIVILPILLVSCTTDHFKLICPPLVTYSPAFMSAAGNELPQAGVHVQTLVTDYSKTRDACRAIGSK